MVTEKTIYTPRIQVVIYSGFNIILYLGMSAVSIQSLSFVISFPFTLTAILKHTDAEIKCTKTLIQKKLLQYMILHRERKMEMYLEMHTILFLEAPSQKLIFYNNNHSPFEKKKKYKVPFGCTSK